MSDALSSAVNGARSQQLVIDNVANNIANINTTAFKSARVQLQDTASPSISNGTTQTTPSGDGVTVAATARDFLQGSFQATGSPTHYAVDGNGFFEVTMENGARAYTRDGSFQLNSAGQLTTSDGLPVSTTGNTPNIVRFDNPQGLQSIGRNLYLPSDASGAAQAGVSGQAGFGIIHQGFLESSNVDEAQEMVNMIVAQRAYEANLKVIKVADEMRSKVMEIRKG